MVRGVGGIVIVQDLLNHKSLVAAGSGTACDEPTRRVA
jgi:hypothetical protein